MRVILSLTAIFVCLFASPTFARRPDCGHALASEERFAFRELRRASKATLAVGPEVTLGDYVYRSVTLDGAPIFYAQKDRNGLTLRWSGRGSVASMRDFAEVALRGRRSRVTARYWTESGGFDRTTEGLPPLGVLHVKNIAHELARYRQIGTRRLRSFGLTFMQPGAALDTVVAGSVRSRRENRGMRVRFAGELMNEPEFRAALVELVERTSDDARVQANVDAVLTFAASMF